MTLVKSRSNRAGQTIDYVFNQEEGFDNVLTNYVYMKKEGRVGGAGRSFYLDFAPDVKFSQKDFKKKYEENKEFRKQFILETRKSLRQFVNTTSTSNDKSQDPDVNEDVDLDTSNIDVNTAEVATAAKGKKK